MITNRIPYMVDLINFLKSDPNIIAQGLDKNILIYSEWTIDKLSKNWDQGIVLQPLSGSVTSNTDRRTSCKALLDWQLMVGTQVQNARSTQQHFEINDTASDWTIAGAYPDAAFYEGVVRQSILDFNSSIKDGKKEYDPFVLLEMQEPEEVNGFLMLKQLYKTKFVF